MEFLGTYNSQLTGAFYQELVSLLKASIQAGEYAGGATFDQTALAALQAQCQSFQNLPLPSAGQRSLDSSFNYPVSLLAAQFAALQTESDSFTAQISNLITEIQKQTNLLDHLLFAAELEAWAATKPVLGTGASSIKWHFGIGPGRTDTSIPELWTDPANGVIYNTRPPVASFLYNGDLETGLACAGTVSSVPAKSMSWSYPANTLAQVEELYGSDWASLQMLEPQPLVSFSPVPTVTPSQSQFIITGQSSLGALPVYVRTSFTARYRHVQVSVSDGVNTTLTPYNLDLTQFTVFANGALYTNGTDYTVNQNGTFTPNTLGALVLADVYFLELFPSYQCSIDRVTWSPTLMLDTAQPYPDSTGNWEFLPINFGKDSAGNLLMPVTDELGTPTGLYIQKGDTPTQSYLLEVTSAASPDSVGAAATLEIDMERYAFLNALQLAPFSRFPMVLKQVEVQGLLPNTRKIVWTGSTPIDRETLVTFVESACSKLFLTFFQPNYSQEQLTVVPLDALRRDTMTQLRAILPFEAQPIPASPVQTYTGAQYEFGVESIQGQMRTAGSSVFVAGPSRLMGYPDVLRFDADVQGILDIYLCYRAFSASGTLVDENLTGVLLTPNSSLVFPFASSVVPSTVAYVDAYLKVIHRSADALFVRYLLQAASA